MTKLKLKQKLPKLSPKSRQSKKMKDWQRRESRIQSTKDSKEISTIRRKYKRSAQENRRIYSDIIDTLYGS